MLRRRFVRPRLQRWISVARCRPPFPLKFARHGVEGVEKTGHVHRIAAHSDNHVVLHHQRCCRRKILLARIRIVLPPQLLPGVCIQSNQPVVRRKEIHSRLPDRNAALPNQMSAMIDPLVVPQGVSGSRVERPYVIRNRDVEHATDQERRALDHGSRDAPLRPDSRNLVDPSLHELVHIRGPDLRKRAVALAAVISIERSPGGGRSLADGIRIKEDMRCYAS